MTRGYRVGYIEPKPGIRLRQSMRPPQSCTPPRAEAQFAAAVPAEAISTLDAVLTAPNRALVPAADTVLRNRFQLVKSTPQHNFYLGR